ncbi:hypothetical protein Tchl_0520 [Thauera chlorobenzoica]|uniref:Uncharacterized protein n=1 Tax=Thauera chlorobenzoica TaxID=96773 RepID=A0A1L6F929_9RHOO|nr:hypothetical protein Tchl_0520 [Thauera chlorobenzoica]
MSHADSLRLIVAAPRHANPVEQGKPGSLTRKSGKSKIAAEARESGEAVTKPCLHSATASRRRPRLVSESPGPCPALTP